MTATHKTGQEIIHKQTAAALSRGRGRVILAKTATVPLPARARTVFQLARVMANKWDRAEVWVTTHYRVGFLII